jgi:pSer/pThr/pTyr-binding forkhead associated (FHA) protein
MTDQNRKTLRSFYCRDYLWQEFEGMTRDLGCSMDYLINEAMRHYARSRDYQPQTPQPVAQQPAPAPVPQYQPVQAAPTPVQRPVQPVQAAQPAQPVYQQPQPVRQPPPIAARPVVAAVAQVQPQAQPQAQAQQAQPQAQPYGQPAPTAVYLLFNGQRYRVDKEQFVIGRGSQMTDLTIRDGNISRKHCIVVQRGGHFFIQDLGSTNGIEFNGKRVEHKRIEEGDTFYLCDYELRFTYR